MLTTAHAKARILSIEGTDLINDVELPWNHGLMRPVEVVAEDGLCVTAVSPMPVSGGAAGANWVAMNAAAGCISKMVSFSDQYAGLAFGPGDGSWQLAQFGGLNQYGEPFAAPSAIPMDRAPGSSARAFGSSTTTPNVPAAESMTRSTVFTCELSVRPNGASGTMATASPACTFGNTLNGRIACTTSGLVCAITRTRR